MKSLGWKTIVTAAAVAASVAGIAVAAAPAQASTANAQAGTVSAQSRAALTPAQLAALPLTDRNLTKQEIDNLAVVLNAYHDAQGATLNVNGFINDFTKTGVFNDEVAGKTYTYQGKTLGDEVVYMADVFPNVHRDLYTINVSPNVVTIELSIEGTFEHPTQTPAGILKPNGANIEVPTGDFWYLKDGKIQKFDCYVGYTDMYATMGVDLDWQAAVAKNG